MRDIAAVARTLGLSEHHPLGALSAQLARHPGRDPVDVLASPETLREWGRTFGPQVTLAGSKRIRRGREEGFEAEYRFADVRQVLWPYARGADLDATGALGFDFVPGAEPVLKVAVRPVGQRAASGRTGGWGGRIGSLVGDVTGWYGTLEELLDGLKLRLAVAVGGEVRRTNAAFRAGPDAVWLAHIDGSAMDGEDLQALLGVDSFSELSGFRARSPAGARIEDLSKVLVIQFR
jgi:hypothetical protein